MKNTFITFITFISFNTHGFTQAFDALIKKNREHVKTIRKLENNKFHKTINNLNKGDIMNQTSTPDIEILLKEIYKRQGQGFTFNAYRPIALAQLAKIKARNTQNGKIISYVLQKLNKHLQNSEQTSLYLHKNTGMLEATYIIDKNESNGLKIAILIKPKAK